VCEYIICIRFPVACVCKYVCWYFSLVRGLLCKHHCLNSSLLHSCWTHFGVIKLVTFKLKFNFRTPRVAADADALHRGVEKERGLDSQGRTQWVVGPNEALLCRKNSSDCTAKLCLPCWLPLNAGQKVGIAVGTSANNCLITFYVNFLRF